MSDYTKIQGSLEYRTEEKAKDIVDELHERGWESIKQHSTEVFIPLKLYRNLGRELRYISKSAVDGYITETNLDGCFEAYTYAIPPVEGTDVSDKPIYVGHYDLDEWSKEIEYEFKSVKDEPIDMIIDKERRKNMTYKEIQEEVTQLDKEFKRDWELEIEWMFHKHM